MLDVFVYIFIALQTPVWCNIGCPHQTHLNIKSSVSILSISVVKSIWNVTNSLLVVISVRNAMFANARVI